jgi:hypothetical protein
MRLPWFCWSQLASSVQSYYLSANGFEPSIGVVRDNHALPTSVVSVATRQGN